MGNHIEVLETGIADTYVHDWTELAAVKEFVQNFVFAKSKLGDEGHIKDKGKYHVIHNSPSGFTKEDLLIGKSGQRDIEGSPGYFGEGMILALLVFARNNKHITIQTNGFKVTPKLVPFSEESTIKKLVLELEHNGINEGVTVEVEASGKDITEATNSFLYLNYDDEIEPAVTTLMMDTKGVYVNGVLVTTPNTILGYNFPHRQLMNRDRTTVDLSLLRMYMTDAFNKLNNELIMETLAKSILLGVEDYLEANSSPYAYSQNMTEEKVSKWMNAFYKVTGSSTKKKVAIGDGSDNDNIARYHGYKVIVCRSVTWSHFFNALGVPTSEEASRNQMRYSKVSTKRNSPEESNNLGRAKRLVKAYYGDYGKVKIVDDLMNNHGQKCDGVYMRQEDLILLDSSILIDKDRTFITLLHETIHRISGASDNTHAFTIEWEKACVGILTKKPVYS